MVWAYRRRGQPFLNEAKTTLSWRELYRLARKLRRSQETYLLRNGQWQSVL